MSESHAALKRKMKNFSTANSYARGAGKLRSQKSY
jgi:hypothetical protein